jgi:septal ring factor EnvC (AmiA/AmiB activator)
MGNLYEGDKGAEVEAVQNGVCVFAGELGALGNLVVVDHGCGVFSYYALLDTLAVEVGDRISRSEELGTLGAGSEQGNLFFALSMDGVFVEP